MLCINMTDPVSGASLNDCCILRKWEYSKGKPKIIYSFMEKR